MQDFSATPREMTASTWRNRGLIRALVTRDVVGRYRGSAMGLAWSLFNPLVMLAIYTFVFSEVFRMKWGGGIEESKAGIASVLFVGLIVYGFFTECVNRAPTLIAANVNYVKKVIFPLEVLPWVALGSALFHAAVSISVLLVFQVATARGVPATAILFPIVVLPLALMTIGFAWFLSSLGVFLKDVAQATGLLTLVLMFLSPVFFPISSLDPRYQQWLRLNPLTYFIEEGRNVLIYGRGPDVGRWVLMLIVGFSVAWAGFYWFQKTRRGFADVV